MPSPACVNLPTKSSLFPVYTYTHCQMEASLLLQYLVDEADGGSLATIQKVDIDDLKLLQSDVKGLELTVVPV